MTYLVVGLDQSTFAPWHENIRAADVEAAREIQLVVAAVIGPNCTVMAEPAQAPAAWRQAA